MMHANIMSFRCGPTLFIAAPDLDAVCTAARNWAARCNRHQIEAADLLLALYYDAHNNVSELLHMVRAAGVAEVYLRHLEAALRLEERQPICFDAAALSAPSMVLH